MLCWVTSSSIRRSTNIRNRSRKPPYQTWRTFLGNHVNDIVAIDFFTVPTATFRLLFCFIVLRHHRRMVIHFNVTAHPTAEWTAQQVVEAFAFDEAPRFLICDRDGVYGGVFKERVKNMGVEEVLIAPRSPWQNPFAEKGDRFDAARASRPCDRAQRTPPAQDLARLLRVLPRVTNASIA